ncbi:MAG: alpha/beta fold hydrolase [Gammaproteobacteria bacterium]
MKERNFESIDTNGVRLNAVVEGDGPLVILLHGWPQCWYLWRHQIDPLVDAGYRVVVPDQRGYGRSSKPEAVEAYNIRELAADVDGLAAALGHERYTLFGHDWGCLVAWNTALLYPQTCTAVMGLSVPFWRPTDETLNPPGMDDRFWYIRYFQAPGVAEAELEADLEHSLKQLYYALSADSPYGAFMRQLEHPADCRLLDVLPHTDTLPAWLSDEDFAVYLDAFRESGFRGPNNWYRNIPVNNALTPELEGARFTQPAAFVAGAEDDVLLYDPEWRETFPLAFDDLRFIEIIDGAGHWLQVEKPAETTAQMLRFLAELA